MVTYIMDHPVETSYWHAYSTNDAVTYDTMVNYLMLRINFSDFFVGCRGIVFYKTFCVNLFINMQI